MVATGSHPKIENSIDSVVSEILTYKQKNLLLYVIGSFIIQNVSINDAMHFIFIIIQFIKIEKFKRNTIYASCGFFSKVNKMVNKISQVLHTLNTQGGRGKWADYNTYPQSFNVFLSVGFKLWGLLFNLIGWFVKLSVQTFQPQIFIYKRDNFVYHYWRCTSIFRPLSYPYRSLLIT